MTSLGESVAEKVTFETANDQRPQTTTITSDNTTPLGFPQSDAQ